MSGGVARIVVWAVRRYAGGPGRSWVWTSLALAGMRLIRSTTGRRELVDISKIKPGQQIVIEHQTISHGKQIKQFKAEKRANKRQAKADKRAARAERRAARGDPSRFSIRSGRWAGRLDG